MFIIFYINPSLITNKIASINYVCTKKKISAQNDLDSVGLVSNPNDSWFNQCKLVSSLQAFGNL